MDVVLGNFLFVDIFVKSTGIQNIFTIRVRTCHQALFLKRNRKDHLIGDLHASLACLSSGSSFIYKIIGPGTSSQVKAYFSPVFRNYCLFLSYLCRY